MSYSFNIVCIMCSQMSTHSLVNVNYAEDTCSPNKNESAEIVFIVQTSKVCRNQFCGTAHLETKKELFVAERTN